MSFSFLFNNRDKRARRLKNKHQTSSLNKESILSKITQYTKMLSRNMETNIELMQNNPSFNVPNSNFFSKPNNVSSTEPNLLFVNFDKEIIKHKSKNSRDQESCDRHERIKYRINAMFEEIKISRYSSPSSINNSHLHSKMKFHYMYKLPKFQANKLIEINRILDKPLREPNEMGGKNNSSLYQKSSVNTVENELETFSNEFNKINANKDNFFSSYNKHSRNKSNNIGIDKPTFYNLHNKLTNETKAHLYYKSHY